VAIAPPSSIVRRETLALTTVRQVLVVRWTAATNVGDVEEMRRVSEALGRGHPWGIAHLNLIETSPGEMQRPSEPAREAMVRMLRDRHVPLRAASVVFPHPGFQAALVRSILGGLLLLSRTPAVVRVHASAQLGAEWIGSTLGDSKDDPAPDVSELLAAVAALA
jgi:hypothetical protein